MGKGIFIGIFILLLCIFQESHTLTTVPSATDATLTIDPTTPTSAMTTDTSTIVTTPSSTIDPTTSTSEMTTDTSTIVTTPSSTIYPSTSTSAMTTDTSAIVPTPSSAIPIDATSTVPTTTTTATTTTTEPPPVIINQPMVSRNLYEKQGTEFLLQCITCTEGTPPYSISRVGVSPSYDPCSRCFEVYDEINGKPEHEFCLYYLPSQGSLSYQRQRTYNVSVVCMDSIKSVSAPAIIDVRIRTNEPPFFNTEGTFRGTCDIRALTMRAGDELSLSSFQPNDPDNDPLFFTMTSDPQTDFFEIDQTSGTIRATRDLKSFCHSSISFSIMAKDTDGNEIGPYVATCSSPDAYQPPTISNLNKEISISEDTPIGTTLVEPYLRLLPTNPILTFDIETFPTSALSNVDIEFDRGANQLLLKKKLDFESPTTQNFNVSIRPQNGYCDPVEHYLFIRTTDANDPPVLLPKNVSRTVNEGGSVIDPGWFLTEEDFGDTDIFSIIGGNEEGEWRIDPSNGFIYSTGTVDIDPNTRERNWTLLVQVEDRAGEKDNATITIVVEDYNDNPPQFTQAVFTTTVMECGSPTNLGQVLMATDLDSDYRGNNVVYFDQVENEFVKIFSDGTAQIKKIPPLGESSSISTYANDQGQVPGPLRSAGQGSFLVTTVPCTTTLATTQVVVVSNTVEVNVNSDADANANANSNANAGAGASGSTFAGIDSLITEGTNSAGTGFGDIFLWVLAGLLGLLLLGLLSYLIFRYCAKFCTGSTSWSDGCGCNRAPTPRHIRPFSQDRAISRQKEDFKSTKKEIEEEEEEEEIVQAPVAAPIVYGNSVVPQAKVQRYLRVRRLVPVKPQHVKVKSMVPVPPNQQFPNGTYRSIPNGPAPPAAYQPAPTGPPTGVNTRPIQGGVASNYN